MPALGQTQTRTSPPGWLQTGPAPHRRSAAAVVRVERRAALRAAGFAGRGVLGRRAQPRPAGPSRARGPGRPRRALAMPPRAAAARVLNNARAYVAVAWRGAATPHAQAADPRHWPDARGPRPALSGPGAGTLWGMNHGLAFGEIAHAARATWTLRPSVQRSTGSLHSHPPSEASATPGRGARSMSAHPYRSTTRSRRGRLRAPDTQAPKPKPGSTDRRGWLV